MLHDRLHADKLDESRLDRRMRPAIPFEISDRPWFGPKSRATEFLRLRSVLLPPAEAVRAMSDILGLHAAKVQRIRFISYVDTSRSSFHYTIALIWTDSDQEVREMLYLKAEEIVKRTGWYPLPQGERLNSRALDRDFAKLRIKRATGSPATKLAASLCYLHAAVEASGGCSIRVGTTRCTVLLDTGLPRCLRPQLEDHTILLSHAHLDHSGGIVAGNCHHLPTVMTTATARLLAATRRVSPKWLKRHAILLDNGQELFIDGLQITCFSVPHSPGACGYLIQADNRSLIYTGDIALRSARHDFSTELLALISTLVSRPLVLLLDGTMAGRPNGASMSDAALSLVRYLCDYDEVVIISDEADQLLYAYADIFYCVCRCPTMRNMVEFYISSSMRYLFEIVHSAYIARELDLLDPFLAQQYGKRLSSWAESRWLYWFDPGSTPPDATKYRRVWFLPSVELASLPPKKRYGLVKIGRARDAEYESALECDILDVDADAWTLHSSAMILAEFIHKASTFGDVILFHNFPERARRFLRRHGLNCKVLETARMAIA